LVIRPRWTFVSDSRCFGGHAGPGAQLLGAGEAGHVADLGDEDRREHRPDAADGLDRLETGMGVQLDAGVFGENVDLDGERVDEPPQRPDPGVERSVQLQLVQQPLPADAEQVRHVHLHTLLSARRRKFVGGHSETQAVGSAR
jgi:hypothetical protein